MQFLKEDEMSKFHVDAVFEQFPWLKNYFPDAKHSFTDAKVGKFNLETLDLEAGYWDADQFGSGNPKIFLFSGAGEHISNVHPRRRWSSYILCGSWMRSVGEALLSLGNNLNKVRFAVAVSGSVVTIYTPPKDRTILDLLNEKQRLRDNKAAQAKKEIEDKLA